MRLMDWLARCPCHVSFGRRGGGITSLQRDANAVFLISDTGETIEIPPAGGGFAGVLDAAGRERLEAQSIIGAFAESAASVTAAVGVAIPREIAMLEIGQPAAAPAIYRRVAGEPAHALKLRTTDRFLPDGSESAAVGGWWEFAPDQAIDVRQAGVAGDGLTDNAEALSWLRDYCVAKGRDRHWHWLFPGGTYAYSNNKWALGLTDLRLTGYGATLIPMTTASFSTDYFALPRESIFRGNGALDAAGAGRTLVIQAGQRFDTAVKGATAIILSTPAEAALYAPGDRVFLHGFCTQAGGYAPNLRFFEWHEIAAVDTGTGTISLAGALAYDYNAAWPDIFYRAAITTAAFPALSVGEPETRFGKPRILKLNGRLQADGSLHHYPRRLVIEGFAIAKNPNVGAASQRFTAQAREVVLRDLDLGATEADGLALDPREAETVLVERCRVGRGIEVDKVVQNCTIRDCTIDGTAATLLGISGGTGCNALEISGCTTRYRIAPVARDSLVVRGNRASSLAAGDTATNGPVAFSAGSFWGGAWAEVSGNTSIRLPSQSKVAENSYLRDAVVGGVDANGNILVPRMVDGSGNDSDVPGIVAALRPGVVVWKKADPRVRGVVADVVDDGAGNFRIEWAAKGNLRATIAAGDTIEWHQMQSVRIDGRDPLGFFGVQTPAPGLLDWAEATFAAKWGVNGVVLAGDGTGAVGDRATFPRLLKAATAYRLTYDMTRSAGSVLVRDGGGTNLATLNASVTGGAIDFTTLGSASPLPFELRLSAFSGTITPIRLVEI